MNFDYLIILCMPVCFLYISFTHLYKCTFTSPYYLHVHILAIVVLFPLYSCSRSFTLPLLHVHTYISACYFTLFLSLSLSLQPFPPPYYPPHRSRSNTGSSMTPQAPIPIPAVLRAHRYVNLTTIPKPPEQSDLQMDELCKSMTEHALEGKGDI